MLMVLRPTELIQAEKKNRKNNIYIYMYISFEYISI